MHDKAGLFDPSYKYAGDWEMWLRAVSNGSDFKCVPGVHGLYYHNPVGLSTDKSRHQKKFKEEQSIFHDYRSVFGEQNYSDFKEYFAK